MPANILVVEDEPAIQELIVFNLTTAGYRVKRAGDSESARQLLERSLPDLVIVDWMLPGQSGLALIRHIRASSATAHLPVVMMTARASEQDLVLALESGADDYIRKPFSPREMLARVGVLLRRLAPQATASKLEIGDLCIDVDRHRVTVNGRAVDLSPTEFRLLHFFMCHPDRVHSRNALIDKVWGTDALINERTVDAHVGRLRSAMGESGFELKVETIRGLGYLFAVTNASSMGT